MGLMGALTDIRPVTPSSSSALRQMIAPSTARVTSLERARLNRQSPSYVSLTPLTGSALLGTTGGRISGLAKGGRPAYGQLRQRTFYRHSRPHCAPLGTGLWEVRSTLDSRRIARVIFCTGDGHMILLHGFIKKTQKTPKADIDLALKRMMEVT